METVRKINVMEEQATNPGKALRHETINLVDRSKDGHSVIDSRSSLTARETEVLKLVAQGFSNKLIAVRLGISERTVKNHLFYIMTKLRAADRTHAVVIAIRLGWIDA